MSSPAYIVEGFTEKLFLAEICSGHPIKRLEINGKNVSLEAIIDRIESLAVLLKGRHSPIVVLFDREERDASSSAIAAEIERELRRRRPQEDFVIGVADRMIENWIVADWEALRNLDGSLSPTAPLCEGSNGKAVLRKALGKQGYSTTVNGPALLKAARPSVIKDRSASFASFVSRLRIDCWWLRR